MSLAVETNALSKAYGDFQAVDGVNLYVKRGSLYGFLGPNGAGKSTTIKMLTGILAPGSGDIRMLGLNPWDHVEGLELKRRTGVVPEDLALFDNLTAREYLTFVGRMHSMDRATIEQRSEELLSVLKLENVEKKLALEYSHGMQKKLAMAAALLPNPELLFLDEPFEGIDAVTASVMRDILLNYVAKGSTVFVTSHVLAIVERICTDVGIIADGKLVHQMSLSDLQQGDNLETKFLELVGRPAETTDNLTWLDGGLDSHPTVLPAADIGGENGGKNGGECHQNDDKTPLEEASS